MGRRGAASPGGAAPGSTVSLARVLAVVRHDLRVLRRNPSYVIAFTVMPVVVMAFLKDTYRATLLVNGAEDVNGAEQAIPGMAVMFSLLLMGLVGFAVFREHGWNTWARIRASEASPGEIILGKLLTPAMVFALQLTVLFLAGALVFDLEVRGSWLAIALVGVGLVLCLVTIGFAFAGVCNSAMQMSALANLTALVMAGLGGALTPVASLPGWARSVAPGVPSYWAMKGFRTAILDGGGVGDVVESALVLLLFAAGFATVAWLTFRFDAEKNPSWS